MLTAGMTAEKAGNSGNRYRTDSMRSWRIRQSNWL